MKDMYTHIHMCMHIYTLRGEGEECVCTGIFDVPVCFYKGRSMSIENKLAMRAYQLSRTAATGTGV